MNTDKIKKVALEIAEIAGKIQLKKWGTTLSVKWKSLTDPVTEVDRACEEAALKLVKKNFPDHAFVGEETGIHGHKDAEVRWYIDPLDGTVNFSHGLPHFSISIGVRLRNQGLVGVVNAPVMKELYIAVAGKGATLNGKKIHVSKGSDPKKCLLVSGFAYKARETGENMREWMGFLRDFQAIRRMGCASLDFCWTAAGRFEGFWEYGLNAWDSAAGELVVREAGGRVSNLMGKRLDIHKKGVLATNGLIHARCLKVLRAAFRRELIWPPR